MTDNPLAAIAEGVKLVPEFKVAQAIYRTNTFTINRVELETIIAALTAAGEMAKDVEQARTILAGTAIGSLPNDYPLSKLALDVWNTLQERTLEGLALVGKLEALSAAPASPVGEDTRMTELQAQLAEAREAALEEAAKVCERDITSLTVIEFDGSRRTLDDRELEVVKFAIKGRAAVIRDLRRAARAYANKGEPT